MGQPLVRVLKVLKTKIAGHFRDTLLSLSLRDSTRQEWEEVQKHSFDRAKQLSDFLAMLVRLGFLWIAVLYFGAEAKRNPIWPFGWMFGICNVFAFILYLFMIGRIATVINVYWSSDTQYWKAAIHKIIISILALAQTAIAVFCVSKLAQAIAKASAIIH